MRKKTAQKWQLDRYWGGESLTKFSRADVNRNLIRRVEITKIFWLWRSFSCSGNLLPSGNIPRNNCVQWECAWSIFPTEMLDWIGFSLDLDETFPAFLLSCQMESVDWCSRDHKSNTGSSGNIQEKCTVRVCNVRDLSSHQHFPPSLTPFSCFLVV